jgi:uncharacterized membrane protein YgdD (TMEM256/DUF423 family)
MKTWTSLGALLGALAVILGAFGAHALKERLDAEQLAWWDTAVTYHMAHALALALFGLACERGVTSRFAGALFTLGVVVFSGTLYAMALGAPRWFGAITPIGGIALIPGWISFALAARRAGR